MTDFPVKNLLFFPRWGFAFCQEEKKDEVRGKDEVDARPEEKEEEEEEEEEAEAEEEDVIKTPSKARTSLWRKRTFS